MPHIGRISKLFLGTPVLGISKRYHLIDILRGLAALSVLFYHYRHFFDSSSLNTNPVGYQTAQPMYSVFWPLYDYGYYAVQVFWMISGFVFAGVYSSREATTVDFILSRLARLYPLHLLTLLVVFVLQSLSMAQNGHWLIYDHNDAFHFNLHIFFASNWGFEAGDSFNGPIWSVSAEVVIYAAFWIILPFLFAYGIVIPLTAAIIFAMMALFHIHDVFGGCGLYFFLGTVLYVIHVTWYDVPYAQLTIAAVMAIVGTAGLAVDLPVVIHVSALAGGMILTLAALETLRVPGWVKHVQWIGNCTYGTYLWHIPIQISLLLLLPFLGLEKSSAESPWFLAIFLGLVVSLAMCSYVWFELPMQRRIRDCSRGWRNA